MEDTHITSEIVWQDTKSDEAGQIVESKLKAGPEENDIISELEELLSNKTLTEKNVRNILTKYKSKSLTESWSTESTTKENSKAPELNKQPITIIEAKFMTKVKQKFDGSVITRWAAMTHYSLGDVQELKPFTRAFGVNDDMRLSQLINLLWDNMDKSLADAIKHESDGLNYSMRKPDALEGGVAFFEKRNDTLN